MIDSHETVVFLVIQRHTQWDHYCPTNSWMNESYEPVLFSHLKPYSAISVVQPIAKIKYF